MVCGAGVGWVEVGGVWSPWPPLQGPPKLSHLDPGEASRPRGVLWANWAVRRVAVME